MKGPNKDLLRAVHTVHDQDCAVRIREPAVLITRVEYANLFHATTELYGVFQVQRALGAPGPLRIILADGHCASEFRRQRKPPCTAHQTPWLQTPWTRRGTPSAHS